MHSAWVAYIIKIMLTYSLVNSPVSVKHKYLNRTTTTTQHNDKCNKVSSMCMCMHALSLKRLISGPVIVGSVVRWDYFIYILCTTAGCSIRKKYGAFFIIGLKLCNHVDNVFFLFLTAFLLYTGIVVEQSCHFWHKSSLTFCFFRAWVIILRIQLLYVIWLFYW